MLKRIENSHGVNVVRFFSFSVSFTQRGGDERASQAALVLKRLPANAVDKGDAGSIPALGRSLEEGLATHSSILAWKIPQRSLAGCSPWGCKESAMTEVN